MYKNHEEMSRRSTDDAGKKTQRFSPAWAVGMNDESAATAQSMQLTYAFSFSVVQAQVAASAQAYKFRSGNSGYDTYANVGKPCLGVRGAYVEGLSNRIAQRGA